MMFATVRAKTRLASKYGADSDLGDDRDPGHR